MKTNLKVELSNRSSRIELSIVVRMADWSESLNTFTEKAQVNGAFPRRSTKPKNLLTGAGIDRGDEGFRLSIDLRTIDIDLKIPISKFGLTAEVELLSMCNCCNVGTAGFMRSM